MINSILQMKKLEPREVEGHSQSRSQWYLPSNIPSIFSKCMFSLKNIY